MNLCNFCTQNLVKKTTNLNISKTSYLLSLYIQQIRPDLNFVRNNSSDTRRLSKEELLKKIKHGPDLREFFADTSKNIEEKLSEINDKYTEAGINLKRTVKFSGSKKQILIKVEKTLFISIPIGPIIQLSTLLC